MTLQAARALKIGELYDRNPADPVKEVLGKINTDESITKNISNINISGITRVTMDATTDFLKKLDIKSYYHERLMNSKASNKSLIAKDIVHYIFSLLPAECNVCSAHYTDMDEGKGQSEVICYICQRGCHPGCYSDAQVSCHQGLLFFCSACLPNIKSLHEEYRNSSGPVKPGELEKPPVIEKLPDHEIDPKSKGEEPQIDKVELDKEKEEVAATTEEKSKIDEFSPKEPAKRQRNQEKPESSQAHNKKDFSVFDGRDVCPLLLKGICPHGISGYGCNAFHPKRCSYFVAAGNDKRYGCTKKGRCKFYHPKLCANAAQLRTCLNRDCKDVHFRGTRRSMRESQWKKRDTAWQPRNGPPFRRERQEYISDIRNDFPPLDYKREAPRATGEPLLPTPSQKVKQCNDTADNDNSKHFLLLLEQMKSDLSLQVSKQISNLFAQLQQQPQQLPPPQPVPPPTPLEPQMLMSSQYQVQPFPMTQHVYHPLPFQGA